MSGTRRLALPFGGFWWCVVALFRYPRSAVVWQTTADEMEQVGEDMWMFYLVLAWGLLDVGVYYGR